jgi:hypothetical protein
MHLLRKPTHPALDGVVKTICLNPTISLQRLQQNQTRKSLASTSTLALLHQGQMDLVRLIPISLQHQKALKPVYLAYSVLVLLLLPHVEKIRLKTLLQPHQSLNAIQRLPRPRNLKFQRLLLLQRLLE